MPIFLGRAYTASPFGALISFLTDFKSWCSINCIGVSKTCLTSLVHFPRDIRPA
ncbi:hypothetical protein GIB67_020052 [Kingdonia uniflora]|uniref:Uncharacterized protein n=1 Tax=Kingdonia uniflora TaxID=39325 RepID=A0A7J7L264_9MAGN|nr:hypothetical protein GIB67_020052 [Kingdonia uniflora]